MEQLRRAAFLEQEQRLCLRLKTYFMPHGALNGSQRTVPLGESLLSHWMSGECE